MVEKHLEGHLGDPDEWAQLSRASHSIDPPIDFCHFWGIYMDEQRFCCHLLFKCNEITLSCQYITAIKAVLVQLGKG